MKIGVVADDFTGAGDIANALARSGARTLQVAGIPTAPADRDADAVVVALKTRSCPAADAVARSLAASRWLREGGAEQIVFKYCSTFDSTPGGNIGPVIDALMAELGADRAIVCPAFPANGRSVYQGHLFVADRLLNESGMETHPLTPMRDPDIRRWLSPQTRHAVGHVGIAEVLAGADAIRDGVEREARAGRPVVVVDAIRDEDLVAIGRAARGHRLVTGASGVALGLIANFPPEQVADHPPSFVGSGGPGVVLSGSCSATTRRQVERHARDHPALEILPEDVMAGKTTALAAADWALERAGREAPLLFSSAEPAAVRAAQERFGAQASAASVEGFFAETARLLTAGGVTRLVVAGGETSGAVVEGLALGSLAIGPEIAPGVPALKATDRPLWLALKSGNFGDADFFARALAVLGPVGV